MPCSWPRPQGPAGMLSRSIATVSPGLSVRSSLPTSKGMYYPSDLYFTIFLFITLLPHLENPLFVVKH